jgi:hypothetical protein
VTPPPHFESLKRALPFYGLLGPTLTLLIL